MNANKEEIVEFLKEAKSLIAKGKAGIAKRSKNLQDIVNIGLTMKGVRQELLDLSLEDYSKGPEPDRDFPGEIWVFGKEINGHEVYIKMKIDRQDELETFTCISFHIANNKLDYPLKAKDKKRA